jgi:signal transduction histidine kinase
MKKGLILVFLAMLLAGGVALAQDDEPAVPESLRLTDEQSEYPLGLYMQILEDPSGILTFDEISSPAYATRFAPSQEDAPVFGYTDSAYWVRFSLDNQATRVEEWMLEVDFSNTQYIDLYAPLPGGGFETRKTGVLRPLSTRDLSYPRIVFILDLPTQSQKTYYARFSGGASMSLGLILWTSKAFWVVSDRDLMLHWLFFGGLLALLVYHLFLVFSLREISYLLYVLMLAGILAVLTDLDGYLGVYVFPGLYRIKEHYLPLAVALMYTMILLFSGEFLELRTRQAAIYWINLGFAASWAGLAILSFFVSYRQISSLMTPWQMVSMGVTVVVAVIAWAMGFRPVRFFLITWLLMATSLLLFLMVRQGIVPSNAFTENIYQLGMIMMAVGWSFSLAERINVLKTETEKANRNLKNNETQLIQILDGMPLGVVVYGKDQKPRYLNKRTTEMLGNRTLGIQPSVDAGRDLVQAIAYFSFRVAGTSESYPVEKLPVYRALRGETAFIDDIEADITGIRLPLEIWASPIRDDTGNIVSVVSVFDDITRRRQEEAELERYRHQLEALVGERTAESNVLNERLQLRIDWLSAVNRSHQSITSLAGLAKAFEELLTRILQLLNVALVFILRWDGQEEGEVLCYAQQRGCDSESQILKALFAKDSELRRELGKGQSIQWDADQVTGLPEALQEFFREYGIQQVFFAPLLMRQVVFGVLGVAEATSTKKQIHQQLDLIERMAFDLANLHQVAFLYDQALTLATLDERNRLARDLHDSVTQVLFSANLLAEVLPNIWRRDPKLGMQRLEKLRQLARGALAEMRTMLLELRPSAVINTPLGELLVQLAEAVTSRSGLPFQLFVEQVQDLPEPVHITFYRIAQEALNNVVKHAQASQITMSLSQKFLPPGSGSQIQREVFLEVRDDGVGFAWPDERPVHMGTGIMNERAAAIDADLLIESQPGHGTQVILTWRDYARIME